MSNGAEGPRATEVWSVVVTFNAADIVCRCLNSLAESTVPMHVVVIDNGSTDKTTAIVREQRPAVELLEAGVNLGFGAACNLGARMAIAAGARYVFFLNPDAFVLPTCVATLVDALESDDKMAMVSPLLVDHATNTVRYAGAELDVAGLAFSVRGWGDAVGAVSYEPERTGRPTGAAMLAKVDAVIDVGMMDPSYFLYWEETEWALRLARGGYAIGFEPRAMAYHESSHSTGGAGSSVLEYYFARNLLRMVRDGGGIGTLATSIRLAPQLAQRVLDRMHAREPRAALRTARSVCLGYLDFWRNRSGPRRSLARPNTT